MTEAQRNLLLALDLRTEGLMKIASLISASSGQARRRARRSPETWRSSSAPT